MRAVGMRIDDLIGDQMAHAVFLAGGDMVFHELLDGRGAGVIAIRRDEGAVGGEAGGEAGRIVAVDAEIDPGAKLVDGDLVFDIDGHAVTPSASREFSTCRTSRSLNGCPTFCTAWPAPVRT